jgi:hypothetical protein
MGLVSTDDGADADADVDTADANDEGDAADDDE